jgi:hypothetical protein
VLLNFQQIQQIAQDAVGFGLFVGANQPILGDPVTLASIQARLAALKPDWPVREDIDQSSPANITGGAITIDYVNRRFAIPTTPPTGDSRIVFNPVLMPPGPPLRIYGYFLSPDSTILPGEFQVQWRTPNLSPADPWRLLNAQEVGRGIVLTNGVQLSVEVPAPPMSARVLGYIYVLAEQI